MRYLAIAVIVLISLNLDVWAGTVTLTPGEHQQGKRSTGEKEIVFRVVGSRLQCFNVTDSVVLFGLEASSGALFLRALTTVQRDAVAGSEAGGVVFTSTNSRVEQFNGSVWEAVGQ